MTKQKNTDKVSKATLVAPVAPAAPAAPAAPVAQAVVAKKPRASKVAVAPVEAVVPVPAVVVDVAPMVASSVESNEAVASEVPSLDDGLVSAFADAFTKLQQVTTMLSTLKTDFRQLEKRAMRELKVANKASAKRRRKSGNRSPSGFVKPTLISEELAVFLGKNVGTEMARTEVTREINAYIRKHNLQDKDNGRKINPDVGLTSLLKLKTDDELTYFNLQRYMSPHFAKSVKSLQAAAAAASVEAM
jgi:upstream activation factor subunit UAF30